MRFYIFCKYHSLLHFHSFLLILWQSTGPQTLFLNVNGSFTLLAPNSCNIPKSLNPQNISKVNTCFVLTGRTRSIHYLIIGKDETFCKRNAAIVNEGSTESGKDDRVKPNDGFDDFEADGEPEEGEDGSDGEVEEIAAEVVGLVGYSTDSSVYGELWFVRALIFLVSQYYLRV